MNIKKDTKASNKIPSRGKAAPAKQLKIEESFFETFIKKNTFLVFTLAELLLIFIVFRKYLLLENTYLFKDEGADTITAWWPYYVHLSEYIRNTGFPKWSFNWGIGKNIYPNNMGNPFIMLLYLLPKNSISYGIIYVEVLQIYLGGLFFFLFLRTIPSVPTHGEEKGMSAFTSIIGGLLYSFSGYMIVGSGWYPFTTETVYAAILLYSCEKFLRKGAWYLIPIPFFLMAAFQPFFLYLYGSLAIIYCLVRIVTNEEWKWNGKNVMHVVSVFFKIGLLALFGVVLSSFIFLSNIDMLVHTTRGFGGETSVSNAMLSTSIFSLSPLPEITTSLYRFFSSDFMGSGNCYRGWHDFIDAPELYTGLLTGLLMPQAFILMGKRKRIIYLGLTILAVLPLIFPFFRHAFWLFTGDYYRTYSLFLSILFLCLSMKTLSALDSSTNPEGKYPSGRKGIINKPVLIISLIVLLLIVFLLPLSEIHNYDEYFIPGYKLTKLFCKVVPVFLIVYTLLIYFISRKSSVISHKSFLAPFFLRLTTYDLRLILGLTILTELAFFSYITPNHRAVVSSAELSERTGYNDYSNEAIAYINSRDTGFFRIDKYYYSNISWAQGGYNDALFQNFKSTSTYDPLNQPGYIHFLNEMNVHSADNKGKWLAPCRTRALIPFLLNEKYILLKQPYPKIPALYDSLMTTGNISILRNNLYLPFGYTYKNYISLQEFRKLNNFQKDKMLFMAFVADTQDIGTIHKSSLHQLYAKDTVPGPFIMIDEFSKYVDSLRKDSLSNVVYNQNMMKGNIKLSQTKLLFLSIPYDPGWQFKVDGAITKPLITNIGFMGVLFQKGEHTIELNYEPPYVKLGWYISGFGLLGYLLLFLGFRKKRF